MYFFTSIESMADTQFNSQHWFLVLVHNPGAAVEQLDDSDDESEKINVQDAGSESDSELTSIESEDNDKIQTYVRHYYASMIFTKTPE